MAKFETRWRPEADALLRQLVEEGQSTGAIAERLGVTRGSVVGRCSRLKISIKAKRENDRRFVERPKRRTRREKTLARKAGMSPFDMKVNRTPEPIVSEPVTENAKQLLALGPNDCRYPLGDPMAGPPHMFCAMPKQGNPSYCNFHHRVVWRQTAARHLLNRKV